jgi:hypothetical protein
VTPFFNPYIVAVPGQKFDVRYVTHTPTVVRNVVVLSVCGCLDNSQIVRKVRISDHRDPAYNGVYGHSAPWKVVAGESSGLTSDSYIYEKQQNDIYRNIYFFQTEATDGSVRWTLGDRPPAPRSVGDTFVDCNAEDTFVDCNAEDTLIGCNAEDSDGSKVLKGMCSWDDERTKKTTGHTTFEECHASKVNCESSSCNKGSAAQWVRCVRDAPFSSILACLYSSLFWFVEAFAAILHHILSSTVEKQN